MCVFAVCLGILRVCLIFIVSLRCLFAFLWGWFWNLVQTPPAWRQDLFLCHCGLSAGHRTRPASTLGQHVHAHTPPPRSSENPTKCWLTADQPTPSQATWSRLGQGLLPAPRPGLPATRHVVRVRQGRCQPWLRGCTAKKQGPLSS